MGFLIAKSEEKQRRLHNRKILAKMKKGESLAKVNPMLTWYPPRPTVKKDRFAINKLYGGLGVGLRSSLKLSAKKTNLLYFKKSS